VSVDRPEAPFEAPEREMLHAWLEYHRATLALKCDGLSDAQLRERAVPPSTMSLLGIVRHMADVELHWFRRVMHGEPIVGGHYWSETNRDGEFDDVDDAPAEEAFATWRAECDQAREIAAPLSLDATGIWPRTGERVSLRWVLVHMIEEYARHNGHADLIRESIDGSTGE
jgi:uncharacterized damage-inducible protein DinB